MNMYLYLIREKVNSGIANKKEKEWLKKNYYGAVKNKNLKHIYI